VRQYTVGDVTQALAAARNAQRSTGEERRARLDDPARGSISASFTDLHSERFGMLAAKLAHRAVERLGHRCRARSNRSATVAIEGFLVEANTSTARLQVHSMRLDSRSGHFTVDQIAGRLNAARRPLPLTRRAASPGAGPLAALSGRSWTTQRRPAREFERDQACSTALPPNAMTTAAVQPCRRSI
jgi:hypothetical protein